MNISYRTVMLLLLLCVISKTQFPYVLNQVMPTNNSEIIAMYSSKSLLRVLTQKSQIFTFEFIKGAWSLTGTKLLNSNAQKASFSANGGRLFYKAHEQLENQVWWKNYWINNSTYYVVFTSTATAKAQTSPTQNWAVRSRFDGTIQIFSQIGRSTVLTQTIPYPMRNQLAQQIPALPRISSTISKQIIMNIPTFDKQVSNLVFSKIGGILAIVYNKNYICNLWKWKNNIYYYFQTLDHPISKIQTPSISQNQTILILPSQKHLHFYQLFGLQSNGGQFILQSKIQIDTIPKTFIATPDYNTLLLANETDIVIYKYNKTNVSYDKKWRTKFNFSIDKISMYDESKIFVALSDKQGIKQLITCGLSSKACNESTFMVSTGKPHATDIFNRTRDIIDQAQPINVMVLALGVAQLALLLIIMVLAICFYKRLKQDKVKIDPIPVIQNLKTPQQQTTQLQINQRISQQQDIIHQNTQQTNQQAFQV